MTKLFEFSRKNKSKMVYSDYQSALKSVSHGIVIPVAIPPAKRDIENEKTYESSASYVESTQIKCM